MKVLSRMILAFIVTGVLFVVLLLVFMQNKLKAVYLRPIEDDLVDISMLLSAMIQKDLVGPVIDLDNFAETVANATSRELDISLYDRAKSEIDMHVYVSDRDGIVIFDSRDELTGQKSQWRDVVSTLKGRYGARSTWDYSGPKNALSFYVGSPIVYDGEIIGVVSVGKRVPDLVPIYEDMRQEAVLGGVAAVILGTILGVLFLVWVTRPIEMMTTYADSVIGGMRVTMPSLGKSDIGRLAQSFENMRDALEDKQYVERYVQTLTHEIKSPLSAIRGAAELLDEDMPAARRASFMQNIRNEVARIQRLIDRMLELSSLEKLKELQNPTPIDLEEVVREVVNSLEPAAAARGVDMKLERESIFDLDGDRFLLRQAINNLISNALDFSPKGGTIHIEISGNQLSVRDHGPGVPDYARERVFERFYSLRRPDSGKKSSGLGLSIVKQVAELHGCAISLDNHPDGGALATFKQVGERRKRGMMTIQPRGMRDTAKVKVN